MEMKEVLPVSIVSAEPDVQQSSSTEASIETIISSTSRSSSQDDSPDIISTAIASKDDNNEKPSKVLEENSVLADNLFSATAGKIEEARAESPVLSGLGSGFDSADSTNDADFLNTQKAVLSAIDLMDKGLEDEGTVQTDKCDGKNDRNFFLCNDVSEAVSSTKISEKPTNNIDEDKIDELASGDNRISDSLNDRSNISDTSQQDNSVLTKQSIDITDLEKKSNLKTGSKENAKEIVKGDAEIFSNSDNVIDANNTDKSSQNHHTFEKIGHDKENNEAPSLSRNESSCNNNEASITEVNETLNDLNIVSVHDSNIKISGTKSGTDLIESEELGNLGLCFKEETLTNCDIVESTTDDHRGGVQLKVLDATDLETEDVALVTAEDTEISQISGSEICVEDMEEDQCTPKLELETENETVEDNCDGLGQLTSTAESVTRTPLLDPVPVGIEISDVEVSVFKFVKGKKEKAQRATEFKLDDMVISSDEDSDSSESGMAETSNVTEDFFQTVGINTDDRSNESNIKFKSKMGKRYVTDLRANSSVTISRKHEDMDVEETNTTEEESCLRKQKEITEIEVVERNSNLEKETVISVEPCSESLSNKTTEMEVDESTSNLEKAMVISVEPCSESSPNKTTEMEVDGSNSNFVMETVISVEPCSEPSSNKTTKSEVGASNRNSEKDTAILVEPSSQLPLNKTGECGVDGSNSNLEKDSVISVEPSSESRSNKTIEIEVIGSNLEKETVISVEPCSKSSSNKTTRNEVGVSNSNSEKDTLILVEPSSQSSSNRTIECEVGENNSNLEKYTAIYVKPISESPSNKTTEMEVDGSNSNLEKETVISVEPSSESSSNKTTKSEVGASDTNLEKDSVILLEPSFQSSSNTTHECEVGESNSNLEKETVISVEPSSESTSNKTTEIEFNGSNSNLEKETVISVEHSSEPLSNKTTEMEVDESNSNSEKDKVISLELSAASLSNKATNSLDDNEDSEQLNISKSGETNIRRSDLAPGNDEIARAGNSINGKSSEKICDGKEADDLELMLRAAVAKNEEFRKKLSLESNESNNKNSSDCKISKVTEVISLVDDDDDDVNQKKKPAAAVNCVNPNCMSGEDLSPPAMFVLSYFGLKRTKGQRVCAECFSMVLEHNEMLSSFLTEGKPLLLAKFPSHKDVILLDSDEESASDNESNLSDDTMSVIRDNLDDVISEVLTKYDFDYQLRESCDIINSRLDKLEEEAREITSRFDSVQENLDKFRKRIYEDFQQEIKERPELQLENCEIPPMPIVRSKLQSQLYNKEVVSRLRQMQQEREESESTSPGRTIATKKVSNFSGSPISGDNMAQDVIALHSESKCEPPPNLPSPGVLPRPKLKVGDLAYTMKISYFSIWVHCRIIEIIPRNPSENDPSTETYRVKIESVKKNAVRTVTGKYLAYPTPARVQLKVGTRVIAIFKEEDESGVTKDNYYVGVIAEPPKSTNKYRYLVFFDDGYTQYCPHENVLVVCSTSKNVWDDIHPEPRDFIRNYLQQYPERPMVKLSRGQIVKVEWNGRWWIVRVLEVDGSLVKVHFDADRRTEWIYRGSTRLGPMYQELAAAKERQTGSLLRSRGFGGGHTYKTDMPYVEYTRGDGDGEGENKGDDKDNSEEPVEEQLPAPRSVARKSTAKKAPEPVISNVAYTKPLINHVPEGRVRQRQLKPKCRPIRFRPHQCSEACVAWTGYSATTVVKADPLVKPLLYAFERLIGNFRGKTIVLYRGPCGRMIRTAQEMLCYLRGTKSQLTIDLFDFDFWVNPLNEFEESSTFGKIEDLSYGKENVRISCVNELDHSMPQYVQYMTSRQPAKDVNLNLDPEFLVGCDCTDDCADRSKCSCWQLTLQGKAYVPDGDLDPLFGYQYRRLPERIATGIYECNSRCKCSMTCQNRVAQQPLSCRLQLFKTLKKGWGIRCLHDIPRGAFICIYAGFLLTEQEANEGGKAYGDEYLAELDYIESVENLKEGYESEAREPSDFEDDESQKDTMDIEYEQSMDSDAEEDAGSSRRPGDIRLRLRRRTADETEKGSRKAKMDDDTISISDEEPDSVRKPKTFNANITVNENDESESKYPSVRELYGAEENVYIMDAKTHGNIGRYLNHSCSPNVFVQNVFVDTHDLRFPWVAFFANQYIPAGTELTWDYNYDVGSVPGKVMLCYCGSTHCRGRLL